MPTDAGPTSSEASGASEPSADATRPSEPVEAGDGGRYWSRWLRSGPYAVALAATVVLVIGTIGLPLLGRGVFLANALLYQASPWESLRSFADLGGPLYGPVGDTVDGTYPSRAFFAEGLRSGDLFGWNPWVAGGAPLASTNSGAVFSPLAFPAYAILPSWYAPAVVKLLVMAVAIGFTYLFCRRIGTGRVPALLAGGAFVSSGFMVMWTNWAKTEVAAFIPALFWATERFLQRRTLSSAIPISLALAAMLLGNFPAVTAYALYVLVPYVAIRLITQHRRDIRRVVGGATGSGAAVAAGGLLVAVVLLPFAGLLGDLDLSSRKQTPDANLGVPNLVTTVVPGAFGLSTEGQTYRGPGAAPNQVESISFVGATIAGFGLLGLALPVARRVPPGVRGSLAAATVVLGAATFAGGTPLRVLQNLPAFSNNFVGRTTSVLGFMVAVLAALGLQALIEHRTRLTRRQLLWFAGVVVATIAVAAKVAIDTRDWVRQLPDGGEILGDALRLPLAIGLLALLAMVAIRFGGLRFRSVAIAALPVLFVVEAVNLARPLTPNESRDTHYVETETTTFLAQNVGHDRVAGEGFSFLGNTPALFGFRSVTGHSFHAPTWKDLLRTTDPDVFSASPTFSTLRAEPSVVGATALDRLGVNWFAARPSTPPFGTVDRAPLEAATCDGPAAEAGGDTLTPSSDLATSIPGAGVRGIVVHVCDPTTLPSGAAIEVSAQHEGQTVNGTRYVHGPLGPGELIIALPGEELGGDSSNDVRLSLRDADDAEIRLATRPDGSVAAAPIVADDDGLRLAFAGEMTVYERETALPRIRWAPRGEVITDEQDRIDRVAGHQLPDDTVVLSQGEAGGDGRPADVRMVEDGPNGIRVQVDAQGDGYLVVADALQSGWTATVDGERADLVDADHAGVAVRLPEGQHDVALRLTPERQGLGVIISLLTAATLVTVGVVSLRRQRRHVAPSTANGGQPAGDPRPTGE